MLMARGMMLLILSEGFNFGRWDCWNCIVGKNGKKLSSLVVVSFYHVIIFCSKALVRTVVYCLKGCWANKWHIRTRKHLIGLRWLMIIVLMLILTLCITQNWRIALMIILLGWSLNPKSEYFFFGTLELDLELVYNNLEFFIGWLDV